MSWYYGSFACGHEGRVNIIGPTKDRQWKADRQFAGLCPECWEVEKQRRFDEANAKAAAEAAEMELPKLTGSEKQIAWANTIRQDAIKKFERLVEINTKYISDEEIQLLHLLWDRILIKQSSAKYWIDNMRGITTSDVEDEIRNEKAIYEKEQTDAEVPETIKEEALEDMTMRPSEPVTCLVAEIRVKENLITAKLPEKDEDFRLLVKGLGYVWNNGHWARGTGIRNGTPLDRATELGVKLLAAGFPIRVYNDALQEKILAADYEPECSRWIMKNLDTGAFIVKWDRKEEDFYKESKKLPGASWMSGNGMLVPREAFREVLDFSDRYQFKLSQGAKELIAEAQAAFDAAMVADVDAPKKEELPQPGSRPVLTPDQVDGEIDADLRDQD